MPSLHFATSVMAAHLLSETGAVAGAVGGRTRARSGVALVYLGEHYVVDLAAGLALTQAVRRARRSPRRCSGASAPGCSGSRRGRAREHDRDAPPSTAEHAARPEGDEATRSTRPGVDISARNLAGFARLRRARDRRARTSCCRRSPGLAGDLAPGRGGQPGLARRSRSLFTVGMFGGYVLLFHGVFARAAEGR